MIAGFQHIRLQVVKFIIAVVDGHNTGEVRRLRRRYDGQLNRHRYALFTQQLFKAVCVCDASPGRFFVADMQRAKCHVEVILAAQALFNDLQVKLTHALDDGFAQVVHVVEQHTNARMSLRF